MSCLSRHLTSFSVCISATVDHSDCIEKPLASAVGKEIGEFLHFSRFFLYGQIRFKYAISMTDRPQQTFEVSKYTGTEEVRGKSLPLNLWVSTAPAQNTGNVTKLPYSYHRLIAYHRAGNGYRPANHLNWRCKRSFELERSFAPSGVPPVRVCRHIRTIRAPYLPAPTC